MALREIMQEYQRCWKAVEEIQAEERRSASMELRWQQINAAYGIAKGLGLLQPDPTEMEVIERWAMLKVKMTGLPPKA